MKPTLLVGDYLFVSKFAYGWSKHSFPFSAVPISGRIMGKYPERGDVVVFKLPADQKTDYIKRVIGLPGDTIRILQGVLYVNDEKVEQQDAGYFVESIPAGSSGRGRCLGSEQLAAELHGECVRNNILETLDNGHSYYTINSDNNSRFHDNYGEITVPEGHLFFLGDNRDNSVDSRYRDRVGMVPFENLVGKALFIFLSSEDNSGAWVFWKWRLSRMFTGIQ